MPNATSREQQIYVVSFMRTVCAGRSVVMRQKDCLSRSVSGGGKDKFHITQRDSAGPKRRENADRYFPVCRFLEKSIFGRASEKKRDTRRTVSRTAVS